MLTNILHLCFFVCHKREIGVKYVTYFYVSVILCDFKESKQYTGNCITCDVKAKQSSKKINRCTIYVHSYLSYKTHDILTGGGRCNRC